MQISGIVSRNQGIRQIVLFRKRSSLLQQRYARGHCHILDHPAHNHGSDRCVEKVAVGPGVVGVFVDGFPAAVMDFVSKSDCASFRRLAIKSDAVVIVRSGRSAGKEDSVFAVRTAASDREASRAGMRRQLAPFDFIWILLIDLAQPAFVGGYITWTARWAGLGAVYDHDSAIRHAAGEPKDRRSGERRSLS